METREIIDACIYIAKGIPVTLFYSFASFFIGFCLSIILIIKYQFIPRLVNFYISIFRGTPLILQLSIIFYGSYACGLNFETWQAGVITFSLNSSAYITEILKSGMSGVSVSEIFSAKSLGISKFYIMKDIVVPQAVKKSTSSLLNELIDLIKESSIISTISGFDLMRRANAVAAEHYSYFFPYLIAGTIYYIIIMTLTSFVKKNTQDIQI